MDVSTGNLNSEEFVEFKIDQILDNSETDFELFLFVDQQFILYSGVGYKWFRGELSALLESGRQSFLIRQCDLPKAHTYRAVQELPRLDSSLSPFEKIKAIDDIGARLNYCIYEGELTQSCVVKARDLAQGLVACIGEDSSCIKAISGLADYDAYTYHHSVRVAAYSVAIAIGMGINDETQLFEMAMGGIFHDIGKKEIPLNVLHKQGALNQEEWSLMRSHPKIGRQIIDNAHLSYVSKEIILHHHERRNGTGYPDGLKGSEVLDEVQIAALADIFDALTSSRSYQKKRTRFEALAFIKSKLLGEEVNPEAYRALVEVLAG